MSQTYTFKIAPEYTIAHYYTNTDVITLDEWSGRTLADFARGMEKKGGYRHSVERVELSGGRVIEEHTWTK